MSNNSSKNATGQDGGLSISLDAIYKHQKPMVQVVISLIPVMLASVYFFGWRSAVIMAECVVVGTVAEWLFCRKRNEKVSQAVLVTALLLALTLPPTVPYSVAAVGVIVAIVFGKEVFGGFGRNVYNPALVGRCFIYICFPVSMTSQWLPPFSGGTGFARWTGSADAITRATPLMTYKAGEGAEELSNLFFGNISGSLGATSSVLILLAGLYLIVKKTANWRIIVACLLGGVAFSALFHWGIGSATVPGPLFTLLAGGFLFGSVFMATDPVSSPSTNMGRWFYGIAIGGLAVIMRGFSNFPEGIMFAILLMNTFVPIGDHYIRQYKKSRREAAKKTNQEEDAEEE
jgi:Na+-transporting NADH:ubiquinone oxidoreductase subunit B